MPRIRLTCLQIEVHQAEGGRLGVPGQAVIVWLALRLKLLE